MLRPSRSILRFLALVQEKTLGGKNPRITSLPTFAHTFVFRKNLHFVGFQGHVKIKCFLHDEEAIWTAQGCQKNIWTYCGTYSLQINKEWRFDYQSFHSFPLIHEPVFSCCESKETEEKSTHFLSPAQHSITVQPYESHYLKRAFSTVSRKKKKISYPISCF